MDRVSKKLVPSLADIESAILLVNASDPQLPTIKFFHEAIEHIPHICVLSKIDLVSATRITEIEEEFGEPLLELSVLKGRGLGGIKKAIASFPKGKVAILGIFNSSKTSLINALTGDKSETGPIPGTTLIVTPHDYMGWTLLDTIGDIWDVNKPLMFSIDLTGCPDTGSKINECIRQEIDGLLKTRDSRDLSKSLESAVNLLRDRISAGSKVITLGAGASAFIAKEMAGQGQETGTPIMCFTNEFAEIPTLSFAKGAFEDELGMSEYVARAVNQGDVVIGVSASGGTAFVHETLRLAKEKAAFTIAITENADTPLGHYADIILKSEAKPEGPSSSKIQLAHLMIGHTLMIVLADERGMSAEKSIQNMLPNKAPNKMMGIK